LLVILVSRLIYICVEQIHFSGRTALNLFDMTPAEQFHALDERKTDLGFVCFRARPTDSDLQWACVGHDIVMAAIAAGNPLFARYLRAAPRRRANLKRRRMMITRGDRIDAMVASMSVETNCD
jgi:hypothetical protein